MQTLSVKLPDTLAYELDAAAKQAPTKLSKSAIIRKALEAYLHGTLKNSKSQAGSFLSLAKGICGKAKGPKDLATNPKHMDGFGR